MKKCSRCDKSKTTEGFHKAPNLIGGRHTICKVCRRAHTRAHLTNMRLVVVFRLGNKCANAGCSWVNADGSRGCVDIRCLQIDHIYGGGYKEIYSGRLPPNLKNKRKSQSGTSWFYRKLYRLSLRKLKARYQILCANCNWIKRAQDSKQHGGMPCK